MFKITKIEDNNPEIRTKRIFYDGYALDVPYNTKWIAVDEDGTICAYLKSDDAPVTMFTNEITTSYWTSFSDYEALPLTIQYEGNWFDSLKQVDYFFTED